MDPPQYLGLSVWNWTTYFCTGILDTRADAVVEAQKKLWILVQIHKEVD